MYVYPGSIMWDYLRLFSEFLWKIFDWLCFVVLLGCLPIFIAAFVLTALGKSVDTQILQNGDLLIVSVAVCADALFDWHILSKQNKESNSYNHESDYHTDFYYVYYELDDEDLEEEISGTIPSVDQRVRLLTSFCKNAQAGAATLAFILLLVQVAFYTIIKVVDELNAINSGQEWIVVVSFATLATAIILNAGYQFFQEVEEEWLP